jgi:hypothetical protein
MPISAWALIYSVPMLLLAISIFFTLKRRTIDVRRVSAWIAVVFTFLSALGGFWGLIIRDQLTKRSQSDYGYEAGCFLLAFIGGISALVWIVRSRTISSFLTLGASAWIGVFWMMMLGTF